MGIALGVAALIVILSVMNGFEGELRDRLLSMTAHGYVSGEDGTVRDWTGVRERIEAEAGVVAAAPLIEMEGMVRTGRSLNGVLVHGIDPQAEQAVSGRSVDFVAGSLDELTANSRNIILGQYLADRAGRQDWTMALSCLFRGLPGWHAGTRLERFNVRGVFRAGVQDHDASLALVHMEDAARLMSLGERVNQVRFLTDDVMSAPAVQAICRRISVTLPDQRLDDRKRKLLSGDTT